MADRRLDCLASLQPTPLLHRQRLVLAPVDDLDALVVRIDAAIAKIGEYLFRLAACVFAHDADLVDLHRERVRVIRVARKRACTDCKPATMRHRKTGFHAKLVWLACLALADAFHLVRVQAVDLAAALALRNKKTLLIDLDPQANLAALGAEHHHPYVGPDRDAFSSAAELLAIAAREGLAIADIARHSDAVFDYLAQRFRLPYEYSCWKVMLDDVSAEPIQTVPQVLQWANEKWVAASGNLYQHPDFLTWFLEEGDHPVITEHLGEVVRYCTQHRDVNPEAFAAQMEAFAEGLMRGLMQTEYTPGSLREKLFGHAHLPARHPGARFRRNSH